MASVFKRGGSKAKGYWIASWFDHRGQRRTHNTRTTDKATALRIANKYEAEAALRRDGVIDPVLDAIARESARKIEDHLADFTAKMRAEARTEKHVRCSEQFIRWIAQHNGWLLASDISADGVTSYVARLQGEGRAARTICAHLAAIKGFASWLARGHKLPRDPLSAVKKPSATSDRRRERRMLLPDEWTWLRSTTAAELVVRYGMSAPERLLLYSVAIQTGLRSNELRSLSRGHLHLAGEQPFVTVRSRDTKNRKPARQYITSDLAADLKQHVRTKATAAPVFAMPHEADVAAMLRDDLAAARRAWIKAAGDDAELRIKREQSDFLADVNERGQHFDFHALRHTCGAWLATRGLHPKVVQTIMRHSTITLTMDTYGHLFPGSEADAVGKLADLLTGPPQPETMRATGTDHASANDAKSAQRQAQRAECFSALDGAKACDSPAESCGDGDEHNALSIATLCDEVPSQATPSESTPGRNRTCNLRIRSPLLYPIELRARALTRGPL